MKGHELSSTTEVDTKKRCKIAHSVVERNYRSRISDGMAELRHCVPRRPHDGSCAASTYPEGPLAAESITENHASGKVGILSNAVQYVKTLKVQNEALHKELDILRLRENTLQMIALSKVDVSTALSEASQSGA